MTRLMLDGIAGDAAAMQHEVAARASTQSPVKLVAGYDDGAYAWSPAHWALFPGLVHVHIAVFATTNSGTVLDCEPGNCTPAQSVDWVLMRRKAGADPTVYCNQLDPTVGWPAVRAAFRARGVAEPHYWVADYDGVTAIPAGAVAKQYEDAGAFDLSSVADYWPGVDPLGADMQWTDVINGPNGRPNGNSVAGILTDLGRLRDALVGDTTALAAYPAGSPLRGLLAVAAGFPDLQAKVAALSAPAPAQVDLAALEALIEQHLAAGSVPGVIAAAVLEHLSAATANAKP
ncbi:hypothetical protein [Actinocrinis sp.]|uniref:hypothetical protein n=1 Tax=Actinocrinis sp. TaxID=1920516 RepID=UPI002D42BDAE|nr:hypothetical protein [Actinocrinis sp.]HZP55022.1 hypothetical protein [Actinocrinis sp.]